MSPRPAGSNVTRDVDEINEDAPIGGAGSRRREGTYEDVLAGVHNRCRTLTSPDLFGSEHEERIKDRLRPPQHPNGADKDRLEKDVPISAPGEVADDRPHDGSRNADTFQGNDAPEDES